jgi:TRAP-type uncharacterized transport system fused permease subunit
MVLDPALIGRDIPSRVIFAAVTGFVGAISMSYGIFGWKDSLINIPLRAMFLIGGMLLLFPGAMITATGAVIAGIALVLDRVIKPRAAAPA